MPYDVDQLLINESGRIGPDIYRKTLNTSPWLKLVKQDTWPDEMGEAISVLTYERSLYANPLSWNTVTYNTGTGNNCVPEAQVINFAQTLRTYNLRQAALESPPICVNDMRFTMKRKEQLSNVFSILQENTSWAWQERYRDEYTRLAEHKMVAFGSGLPESSSEFPLTAPNSRLTQGILDKVYLKLVRDGAGNNPMGRQNGKPEFTIICSPETSDALLRDDANVRNDYRWNPGKVNELLAPLGVDRSYRGYYHLIDLMPPRWDFVAGAWVRRYPYASVAATQGNKFDVSPDYENAAYEDTIVFHQDVFTSLIPAPITSPGGNVKFDPVSYRGDFKWKNILDKVSNPDGLIGYFRGVLSSGSKPVRPEWGYVIRHRRCDVALGLVNCS
jgi:hypothetical protein